MVPTAVERRTDLRRGVACVAMVAAGSVCTAVALRRCAQRPTGGVVTVLDQLHESTRLDRLAYTEFVKETGGRLRLALIAAYGASVGEDATADALAYGWEHWDRISRMQNPAGYLYRVGQTKARRGIFRPPPNVPRPRPVNPTPWVEPGLAGALDKLTVRQRTVVMLVHGFGWTISEVAELWDVRFSTAKAHLDRGMRKLREQLGVDDG
jgi:DNA-directed RNA polymerase specialized sigma24 family protein